MAPRMTTLVITVCCIIIGGSLASFWLERDKSSPRDLVAPPETSVAEGRHDNTQKIEKFCDDQYWKWQSSLNKFGGAFKGDIIQHLLAALPRKPQTILEFGCGGGYILNELRVEHRYGVEINPSARAFARDTFPGIEVFERNQDIPDDLTFDAIYSTSVLEHVECPFCALRELKYRLNPAGILIIGLRNDGVDPRQTFKMFSNDQNHHIYTWNALLLGNLLDAAGFKPCNVIAKMDAWHGTDVDKYKEDKVGYCLTGLKTGKRENVENLWAVAVPGEPGDCRNYKQQVDALLRCDYLKASGTSSDDRHT